MYNMFKIGKTYNKASSTYIEEVLIGPDFLEVIKDLDIGKRLKDLGEGFGVKFLPKVQARQEFCQVAL